MRFLLFFKTNSKIKLSDFTFDLCVYLFIVLSFLHYVIYTSLFTNIHGSRNKKNSNNNNNNRKKETLLLHQ